LIGTHVNQREAFAVVRIQGGASDRIEVAAGIGANVTAEGAEASVHLATLDADGPSGIPSGHLRTAGGPSDAYGPLPW
jgi:dihydrodipicolinate synthase/N-acetylneuraminate lyase